MDPKTQMPDIKAEVLKTDDGKKKGAGLLGLFGGGGSGAAGGLGGLGAGAAGGGGLLATKAGMLALVLMGSAVAGGIGLAGYKMFGPGEADRTGGNLSLFHPKPPQAASDGAAPVNADGSSASLSMMAQASARDKEADATDSTAASAAAPADSAAGDPAKDAAAADAARREAAARAASAGAINSGGGAGAVGAMGLTNTKKLGALSGPSSGGASTTAGSGSVGKLGDGLAAASRNGASSGFSKSGPGAVTSRAAGRAARGGRGARAQARNVMGDQAGGRAGSSFAAGRTYDGSATQSGGAIGPDGGAIGMGGAGDGVGAQPKALPANATPNPNEQDPPVPAAPAKDVTPWAKEIMIGMALGGVAVALLMWASSMIKEARLAAAAALATTPIGTLAYGEALAQLEMAKMIIWGAIAAASLSIVMGGVIAGGENGQKLQGGLLMASSGAILAAAWMYMASAADPIGVKDLATTGKNDAAMAAFSSPDKWVYVIGAVGAVGLVGTMMSPKKTCKSDQEGCHAYYQRQPSPVDYTV
jgi:hypothetical protein